MNTQTQSIDFTRISSDSNGNPRYVCDYTHFISETEAAELGYRAAYKLAVKRANSIGGRAYNTKKFDACIVITSYNICRTTRGILSLVATK